MEKHYSIWAWTTQMTGLLISTIICITIIMLLYFFIIKKQKDKEFPTKGMVALEMYYKGFVKMIDAITNGKNEWTYSYLFALFHFIVVNTLVALCGFEAANTTLMFTLPLTLITFILIYIIGIGTMGLFEFIKHKYSNPLELIGQFIPLLSMSIRLFAASLAGAIIGNVFIIIVQGITGLVPVDGWNASIALPFIQGFIHWPWLILDTALGIIQAYIFVALSASFWALDTGPSWSPRVRSKIRKEEKIKKKAIKIEESKRKTKILAIKEGV